MQMSVSLDFLIFPLVFLFMHQYSKGLYNIVYYLAFPVVLFLNSHSYNYFFFSLHWLISQIPRESELKMVLVLVRKYFPIK